MVRTRDTASVKVSGGKATRKISYSESLASSSDKGSSADKNSKYAGGNAYCPRETPAWQKSITTFFPPKPLSTVTDTESGEGSSKQQTSLETTE